MTLDTLLSFVPSVLHDRVRGGALPSPGVEHAEGIVLVSDISGVTALALSMRDEPRGVERLNAMLNDSFAHLVEVITSAGGDILDFAGDALTAYWPAGEHAAAAAGWAALEAQRRVAEDTRVRLRIGLSCGPLELWTVGGEGGQWFLTQGGAAPAEAAALQAAAGLGDVAVSTGFAAAAGARARTTQSSAGIYRLDAIDGEPPRAPVPDRYGSADRAPDETIAAVRCYVPRSVVDRVIAGHEHFLSELRTVTFAMLRTPGLEQPAHAAELQEVVLGIQRCVYGYDGSLQVGVDDKGITFNIAFGVPPFAHEDVVDRALCAARALDLELTAASVEHGIGVATGLAYCGTLGGAARREYALMSDVPCVAARLAAAGCEHARTAVIYDASTAAAAPPQWVFSAPVALRMKGNDELITSFSSAERVARSGLTRAAIVGRAPQLQRVLELVRDPPERPGGRLVLIEGELGVGKSSLLGVVHEALDERGRHVRVGFADPLERAVPLRAWQAVFSGVLGIDDLDRARVADLLGERVGALAPLLSAALAIDIPSTVASDGLSFEQRMVATRSMLIELLVDDRDANGGLVILLEDAHWFDSASWSLLADVLGLPGVTVVATTRPLAQRPAAPELASMDDVTERVRLDPLTPEQVGQLARVRLGADRIDGRVRDLLVDGCRGNPFFTVEVLRTLVRRDALTVRGGTARLADDAALRVPDSLQAAITAAVDNLSADQQLTLKLASVVGSPFTVDVVASIHPTGRSRSLLTADLDWLIDRELVDADPRHAGSYGFHHALTGEVTYGLMLHEQRRALHRALAEHYESEANDLDQFAAVLAHHWLRAEDDAKAVAYLARAAGVSQINGMPRESVAQGVQAARILGFELETDPAKIGDLLPTQLAEIERLLMGRRPADLAALPELQSPDVAASIGIVLQAMPAAYQSQQAELFALMAIRLLNTTLRFGAGDLAACVYAMYAIVLLGSGTNPEMAYEFSELARSVDASADGANAETVGFIHAWFHSHWRNPFADSVPIALASAEAGMPVGDRLYVCFALATATVLHAQSGAHLDEVIEMSARHGERIGPHSSAAAFHNRLEGQVAKALAGRTRSPASLTSDDCDETDLAAILRTSNFTAVGCYHAAKLRLQYLAGRPKPALRSAERARALLPAYVGLVAQIELTLYGALARLADIADDDDPASRAGALAAARDGLAELERWATRCPQNFAAMAELVRGELGSAEGDHAAADAAFALAEERAAAEGLVHLAALACERRGHAALSDGRAPSPWFAAAAEHYAAWGALAKARELEALAVAG